MNQTLNIYFRLKFGLVISVNTYLGLNMFYIKVKSEYRCEKLLMMFLLTVTIIDPLIDIKAISFM